MIECMIKDADHITLEDEERGLGFGKIWASLNFFGTYFDNLGRIAK